VTVETPPEPALYRLRLDPGFAGFYGLPREIPFRVESPDDPGMAAGIRMAAIVRSLEATRDDPVLGGDPALLRFLSNWPLIERMERYLKVGNYTFARQVADELERQDPGLPCAAWVRGMAASREEDFETAADELESCLSTFPRHPDALEELATVLALSESWDGALLILDRLDALVPENGGGSLYRSLVETHDAAGIRDLRARLMALSVASTSGERDGVLEAAEALTRAASANAEAHRRAAVAVRHVGDRGRALTLAQKAARLDPRSATAHLSVAGLAIESGDLMEAERAALMARSLAPEWLAPVLALASALRADGRPAGAALVLNSAAAGHPNDMGVIRFEAICLLEAGRYSEARTRLEVVARKDPLDPAAHFNLARAHEALRDSTAARGSYALAIKRAPHFAAAREALALLDFREGHTGRAREALEMLVRDQPDSPYGYRGLGDLVVDSDPAEAARLYEEAMRRQEGFACAGLFYLAGLKALLERDYVEAGRLFETSLRSDARSHRAWCNLGVARFHEGNLEQAIFAMEQAVWLEPGEPGYRRNLAVFCWKAFWKHPVRNWRYMGKARRAGDAKPQPLAKRGPVSEEPPAQY
jgi:tetratricopeptide (TPR) repeat protein